MRVVQDDDQAFVAWLAPGTVGLGPGMADGRPLRDRPLHDRFTDARMLIEHTWQGAGVLKIAPTGAPYSAWLFRDPATNDFLGWYGNLEAPLNRQPDGVWTEDHVLDVWMYSDGTIQRKDEDEFAACLDVGWFSPPQGEAILAAADLVTDHMRTGAWPFDGSWMDWRPHPSWSTPTLADDWLAKAGEPAL